MSLEAQPEIVVSASRDGRETSPCQVLASMMISRANINAYDFQPPGHFKVLRVDQDLQDVRGGEVQGAVLPDLQKPVETSQRKIRASKTQRTHPAVSVDGCDQVCK